MSPLSPGTLEHDVGPEVYKDLLVAFLSHLSVQRLELEDAAANEDLARAQEVAHQIKGTALSFDATRLDAAATRLLDLDGAGGELLSSLVTEIDAEISTLQDTSTGVEHP
jgi:HPt (histidine-containing phosphotransfer) domain-containing protein